MMLIALAPTFFLKKPVPPADPAGVTADSAVPPAPGAGMGQDAAPSAGLPAGTPAAPAAGAATVDTSRESAPPARAAESIVVRSPLYTYTLSTQGGRITAATLHEYRSTILSDSSAPVQIVKPEGGLLALRLVAGGDTIPLDRWIFTPSATSLVVDSAPASLTLSGSEGGVGVELTYTFTPEYHVAVAGRVSGIGPDGGLVLVDLGRGLRNTEADSGQNFNAYAAIVSDADGTERTDFRSLDAGETEVLSGPFEWAAVKSKYFVASVFAFDSMGARGRISGVRATAAPVEPRHKNDVHVVASMPVPASGLLSYAAYLGPMEYDRLRAIGHGFDDVNPYGWPGFRTIVRFFAVPVRWLLVQMHENLNIAYGLVLVLFGIMVRVVLWPLNQKAMRANMKMQEMQPQLKAAQERYKDNPQMLQTEMFRLYKEYGVNPMSGCWPMLLPMPVLFALFFVFQNAIELRGQSFLWLPDLAQKDPFYIIPLVMGGSMYVLSKVGQAGMEPNPQMKMMLYIMPVMMTVLFINFASGLNLYYAVSNIASIPQQWMLANERKKRAARAIVEVKTKKPKDGKR
ncbi:MAG TPA: membrane protein insertase YidC, partial [Gemmatimonadales bacterium]|nr:membrane protein insertase YidC [Gemmatimonadales bacterium]